jgi:hypothetical protein
MNESDMQWFGDNIQARWQSTDVFVVGRAFDLCKKYKMEDVLLAMDRLKEVTIDKLVVESDRLAAVCRQLTEGDATVARTARQLAQEREQAAIAEEVRSNTYSTDLTPQIASDAELACAQKYDAAWRMFSPASRERLMKAWAKGGFPE